MVLRKSYILGLRESDVKHFEGHNGYRHSQHNPHHHSLESAVALLALNCLLRAERLSLRGRAYNLDSSLHSLPRDLDSHDTGLDEFPLPGNNPHGLCHHCRDVDLHLRAGLGPVGGFLCVGALDG